VGRAPPRPRGAPSTCKNIRLDDDDDDDDDDGGDDDDDERRTTNERACSRGPGLKTGPGGLKATILTSAGLLWRAPSSKQAPGN
jgi:hypothetical protein